MGATKEGGEDVSACGTAGYPDKPNAGSTPDTIAPDPADASPETFDATPNIVGGTPDSASPDRVRTRLEGPVLKLAKTWLKRWQLRWFVVENGFLSWWDSPEACATSAPPKGRIEMQGCTMSKEGLCVFHIEGAREKEKVYTFSIDVKSSLARSGWPSRDAVVASTLDEWVKALE